MHRAIVHRWIVALALVATLGVMGARPAAAADLRAVDRLASLWSAVSEGPAALWEALLGWLGGPEKADEDRGVGLDPNGVTSHSTNPSDPSE